MVNFSRLLRSTPTSHESVCRWHGTPQRKKKHNKGFSRFDRKDTKKSSTLIISQQKSKINCWIISSFLTVTINWYPFFTRVFHHFKHWGLHFNELQLAHQLCSNLTTSCVIFFPLVQNLLTRPEMKPWLPDNEKGYFGMVPSEYQKHLKAKSPRRLVKKVLARKNWKLLTLSKIVQHVSTAPFPFHPFRSSASLPYRAFPCSMSRSNLEVQGFKAPAASAIKFWGQDFWGCMGFAFWI